MLQMLDIFMRRLGLDVLGKLEKSIITLGMDFQK
jgi:hypothetical protein